ncbi:unnamed protein product [Ilex paraguariensis]|uniref:Uncharacterized protein n=1 Tax=Ilex paraguariensis TaxID=185542 RepID=A0ABC8V5L6_9AQUA
MSTGTPWQGPRDPDSVSPAGIPEHLTLKALVSSIQKNITKASATFHQTPNFLCIDSSQKGATNLGVQIPSTNCNLPCPCSPFFYSFLRSNKSIKPKLPAPLDSIIIDRKAPTTLLQLKLLAITARASIRSIASFRRDLTFTLVISSISPPRSRIFIGIPRYMLRESNS